MAGTAASKVIFFAPLFSVKCDLGLGIVGGLVLI